MGKIVITTNVSLDGVVQDPDGREGFKHGGWFTESGGKDLEVWAKLMTEETLQAAAMLLGRKSEEWFATRWQSRTGPWADRLNSMPKYVVSSTLKKATWSNATVLGKVVEDIPRLKQQIDGEILVYASYQLTRTLLEERLVDEIRLVVFPIVLGAGDRLFGEASHKTPLHLLRTRPIGEGLVSVAYEVVRATAR